MPIQTFVERVYTLRKDQADCILLDWDNEQIVASYLGKRQDREMDVNVNIYSKSDKDVSARLDGYAEQVEPAISYTLGGLVTNCQLMNIEQGITSEGEKPIGILTMTYRVKYRTPYGDPTQSI